MPSGGTAVMSLSRLTVFHSLPAPLQTVAASARGVWLNAWRYGPETESLVAEARERESWSPETWRTWQGSRCAELLNRAATRVPYYREQWQERRRRGDRLSVERLENWPVLRKENVRVAARRLIADDCEIRRLFHEHTSGTTGTALNLWFPRSTLRRWYALYEARIRRWNGVTRHDRWAIFGGQLVASVERKTPPYWVWNAAMRQLYCSAYHLAPQRIPSYLDALKRYRPAWVLGYASALATLAQGALEGGGAPPRLNVVISNAEPLYPHQRERIAHAFDCAVRDTYGMAETVLGGSECSHSSLHIWPEVGILEVLRDDADEPVPAGASGRVVATGLLNPDMPLVRYEVGDRAVLDPSSVPCPCGRLLPRLSIVEGRLDDIVLTPEGARVGRLDPVFKADLPVREAQIVQEEIDLLRVRVVPAPGWGERDREAIVERVRDRVGCRMNVLVEEVTVLERTTAGKFRAVVSHLPRELRDAAEGRWPEPIASR
jgi:phenylacetate-CoA ligase